MKYRHIVFDIDGTLIDTEYAVLHPLQDTLRAISGKEIPVSELTFALGITGKDALEILGIKDLSRAQGLWDTYWRGYADTVRVFDGIIELLDHLQRLGCRMGIVTSQTREEFRQNFCPFGIRPYFKTIVRAEDTREHKPSAAPLFKYLETAEADERQVLYIGDSPYDSQCAENAGIDFALAVWGSRQESIRADYFLKSPLDLITLIT